MDEAQLAELQVLRARVVEVQTMQVNLPSIINVVWPLSQPPVNSNSTKTRGLAVSKTHTKLVAEYPNCPPC